jgi:hypothetical protein
LAVLFFLTESVWAQTTIHVPADQPSIQAAIVAASNGDTVLVAPGTYTGLINFMGKSITVTSSGGPSQTILDGGGAGSVVTFSTSETNAAVLSGFTIQNGCGQGGGININFASPIIQYNIIRNNNAITCSGDTGGGIYIGGADTAQIIGNEIYGNKAWEGGGIESWAAGSSLVENNFIHDNTASQGGGIDIENDGSSVFCDNAIVANQGGGVSGGDLPGKLCNNTIAYNSTNSGSAEISFFYWSGGTVVNNLIVAAPGGTAVNCQYSYYNITPVNFLYNDVYASGGTAYSNCTAQTGSNNNISADPLFADPANEDFHVATGSPVIGAGLASVTPIPSTDAGGDPRLVNGAIDIGGYEYQGTTTMQVSPGSLSYSAQKINTPSAAQSVTVTNNGTKRLHFSPMQIGADFTESSNCSGPNGLAIGASCTISVAFQPQTSGSKSEALAVTGANVATGASVVLTGQATAPAASLSTTSLSFGNQALFTTSAAQSVTLTNTGNASLVVSSVVASGDFAVTHNCATLAPGANCSASVTFSPTATRARTGTLTFTDDAPGSPQQVALSGTGTGPEITFSSPTLAFAPQSVSIASSPLVLTVTNTGTASLVISSIRIAASWSAGSFTETDTCSSVAVPPSGSCQVSVTFTPAQYGSNLATLLFNDNAAASPQGVMLTGIGLAPVAYLGPASITFPGTYVVGGQSAPAAVYYGNWGNAALGIGGIATSANFTQTNNCGAYVVPGAYCTISVTFAPTAAGSLTGTLTVYDNAAGSPRSVTLAGQAIASYPVPVLSSVSPSAVPAGSSSTVITITGTGFFPASTVYLDGSAIATTFVSATSLTFTPPATLTTGAHSVTVVNPAPGGGSSNAMALTAFLVVNVIPQNMVYDPYRRVFYVSVASTDPNSPNTVITVDPVSGTTAQLAAVGGGPLALSDDGEYLYVGAGTLIERVNLYTSQIDLTFSLGASSIFGPYLASSDIKVLPGAPHSVAVALTAEYDEPAVTIFDDGQPRANSANWTDYISMLAFGADSSTLYGTSNYAASIYKMTVDSTGISSITSYWNEGGWEPYYLSGLLFSGPNVYDANTLASVTNITSWLTNTNWSAVYPEPGTGMIYVLGQPYFAAANFEIVAGSQSTWESSGNIQLTLQSTSNGYPVYGSNIERWGRDGLAFQYSGGDSYAPSTMLGGVVFLHTALTNPSTSNNPVPAISELSPSSAYVGSANLQMAVVGNNFVPGAVVQWNGADRTTTFVSSTQLNVYISSADLANPGTASVTVINPTPAGGTSGSSTFRITGGFKTNPILSWQQPQPIVYGTALSATQLNAAASVAGSFTYNPPAGTVLGAGPQTLSVTFTPTDTTDYVTATAPVTLTVKQATPVVSWATPVEIVAGTPLSSTQLNASANVPGQFSYNPAAGTVLSAGIQTLTATFTPTDTVDYASVTSAVTLSVIPAVQARLILNSLSAESVSAGTSSLALTVYGADFMPSTQILWNGSPRPTTYIDSTQVVATIAQTDLAQAAAVQVSAADTEPITRGSMALPFLVEPATPVAQISGCSLGTVPDASGNYTLMVTGMYFDTDATVQWNGTSLPTNSVSAWTLSATVTASQYASYVSAKQVSVTIANSAGTSAPLIWH